uniref:Coatomer subunit zeta n=2 Tax=Tetraselmis sp. GSL018 TaxID=582737 RepID=A0A061QRI4_9CHLO
MEFGRIHCILLSTRSGQILVERFHDTLTNEAKSEIRAAMYSASTSVVQNLPEDSEHVFGYGDACIVYSPVADIILFLMGSGEYDELMLSSIIRVIKDALKATLKKSPSEAAVCEKYAKVCVTLDEVVNEGVLDMVDPELIRKAVKLKAPGDS